ncbi:hypothetical protein AB0L05_30475 [Nonomuraea pusilla]|uniref:hypothetical protein n=1 Tax=Nonomuraea pusilla TaxID=46177 RepID=UPI003329F226
MIVMLTRSRLAVAAFCLISAAGCTSPAPEKQPAGSGSGSDKPQLIQVAIANCMKGKGFKYVPWVPKVEMGEGARKAMLGDYEEMRKDRSENGFGIFVPSANRKPLWKESDSPNSAIKNQLSEAQLASYDKALTGCRIQAVKQVTGKVVASDADLAEQENKLIQQAIERDLNGDPTLIELASAMGDCLKGKGYRVDSLRPSDMERRGSKEFEEQKRRIALNDDIPENGLPEGRYYEPHLSAATTKQYLAKEVKAALDDLECGKDFYPAYLPRTTEIAYRVSAEFGKGL